MTSTKLNHFYNTFGKALDNREAALFIGAGMSAPAGYPTWKELLRSIATELGLDIERELDLVTLAQFHINTKRVRGQLTQLLQDEYGKSASPTENHMLIATLPVEEVWTTNYDQLIERSFQASGKRCDVKITSKNFGKTVRGKDVTVYKMHGDVTQLEEAVITKEDYELYPIKREVYSNALKNALVSNTFLFIGFSLTDPNVDYILSRIRVLMGQEVRTHYLVMKWPTPAGIDSASKAIHDYEMIRLNLRIEDLKRYGIEAIMIDDYNEITSILKELNRRAHRKSVYVSGAAYDYPTMSKDRVEELSAMIGREIISRGYTLVSGFGLGIGSAVLVGALEEVYRQEHASLSDQVLMRPFPQLPQDDPQRAYLFSKYRRDMLSKVGYTIFLCGNKVDTASSKSIQSDGVLEEFTIAKELKKYPIPVGATGSAAKAIWDEVMAAPKEFFAGCNVTTPLGLLGDESKSNSEIVDAIFKIIQETSGL